MLSLGMDIGTSTVKLVLLRDGAMAKQWMAVHHGRPFACLKKGLSALELDADTPFSLCVTGSNTEALLEQAPDIPSFGFLCMKWQKNVRIGRKLWLIERNMTYMLTVYMSIRKR